jgi:hypothetical protein
MWSNRMLVLGAAAVGAAALMVGPAAAPASAEPCAPMVAPTPGCTAPDVPPPNTAGAPEGAGGPGATEPPTGEAAAAPICPTEPVLVPGCVPAEGPPPATALADSPQPPPNPCNDVGYFMSNTAICMNPQIAGEAQPAA